MLGNMHALAGVLSMLCIQDQWRAELQESSKDILSCYSLDPEHVILWYKVYRIEIRSFCCDAPGFRDLAGGTI